MKYVESYMDFEFEFRTSQGMITIPKKQYKEHEIQNGKRRVIAVEDAQLEELLADATFKSLCNKQKGGYRILDNLPQKYQLSSDLIKQRDAKIASLENQVTESEKLRRENDELKKLLAESSGKKNTDETVKADETVKTDPPKQARSKKKIEGS